VNSPRALADIEEVRAIGGSKPIFRSLILNSVFGNFLSADFEGVTQQKVGAWRVYRPNLFSESMIFG
jgi:hypothetical protein